MRDFFKLLLVGIILVFAPVVFAQEYKVIVLPDNIVTENASLDSYIYDAASEFFADEVINILNQTDFITAPRVSETRHTLKGRPNAMLAAKSLTDRFRTTYNVDYNLVRKLAVNLNAQYVLLITSYIDSENYILRRTFWDFLNIAGATVVDPAYKVSTYAVLVDTNTNHTLWSDTFYKTISVCENRIITRGPSPQTEQLQKIKDYSRLLCPEIAQNVQKSILPPEVMAKESNQIYYDIGNIDNVFTKKYRRWGKETNKVYNSLKSGKKPEDKLQIPEKEMQSELEVEAKPVYPQKRVNNGKINSKESTSKQSAETKPATSGKVINLNQQEVKTSEIKDAVYKKPASNNNLNENNFIPDINYKKNKKNTLYGDNYTSRPPLRNYAN